MIIGCPVCRTRYLVDEQALRGRVGRTVRCATCGNTWHQAAPPELHASDTAAQSEGSRIEPALEVPPRPRATQAPSLDVPPREGRALEPRRPPRRRRWTAVRWFVLLVLFGLAVLAGIVVARGAVVAMWPAAARLYTLAGLPIESPGAGFKIDKLAPSRSLDSLIVEGEITNTGKATRDVPRLRIALHDTTEKEVQFKIIDPPQPRLPPGGVAHFKTSFEYPDDAAKVWS